MRVVEGEEIGRGWVGVAGCDDWEVFGEVSACVEGWSEFYGCAGACWQL